jgi:hypothetical protein
MSKKPQLRIVVAPNDIDAVMRFFERTAYDVGQTAPDELAVTAPSDLDERLARREVELYVRMLERLHPEVDVSITSY